MYGDHTVPGPPSREALREAFDARIEARGVVRDALDTLREAAEEGIVSDTVAACQDYLEAWKAYDAAADAYDEIRSELRGWGADA